MKERFITFEGIDGAGKTSQINLLYNYLIDMGNLVIKTREPGGTKFGEKIRKGILSVNNDLHLETETLLLFSARNEHINKIIKPHLEKNYIVLCDRFVDATYAYQGGGCGLSSKKINILENWLENTLKPDLTFYIDIPVEIAQRRFSKDRKKDRFEMEKKIFHEKVRMKYLERADKNKDRIKIIDGTKKIKEIHKSIRSYIFK